MKKSKKRGAVLVEVVISLFIASVIFIGVYSTISISLINTRYLEETNKTHNFTVQLLEGFEACSKSDALNMFDFINSNYGGASGRTEVDLQSLQNQLMYYRDSGVNVVSYYDLIEESVLTKYKIELYLLSENSVYIADNSLGAPFGSSLYSPQNGLLTFELKVSQIADSWGGSTYSLYSERTPAVVSYIFHMNVRG